MASWNLWHGCHKISAGCAHCYVYRIDERHGRDSSVVAKTGDFNLPIRKNRTGEYKIKPGETLYTCFTSDFLLEDADEWREEAWSMIKTRSDVAFFFITKRIDRLSLCLPPDWGDGYDNVHICCTVENQDRADYRLPIFINAPIKKKSIICEPLLEKIDLSPYLGPWIDGVTVGGESGEDARACDYDWVLELRRQCVIFNVPFHFKQTGAKFLKEGKLYRVKRQFQFQQARRAGIEFYPKSRP
ncbi:MAG: DUF5131 family protein [Bacillota bacterium]|nr:DUF5131 family protein [Bacillota bacterium]